MAVKRTKAEYYNIVVEGDIVEGSRLLTAIADAGVDFLAYKAIPVERNRTRFSLFPVDGSKMTDGAMKAGVKLQGPFSAVIVTGDEKPGALAEIYGKLSRAGIQIEESSGIAHINDGYGVILYVEQEDCDRAMTALGA